MTTTTTAALRTARDTGVCVDCGRSYVPRAKPRWAFTHDGRLVGSVHQMHTIHNGYPCWTADGSLTPEEALFSVWLWNVPGIPDDRKSDAHWAWFLASSSSPTVDLSADQRELLDWWLTVGPLKLGQQREAGILAAYRALIERFLAWRETGAA
jgi:hypothetical protein